MLGTLINCITVVLGTLGGLLIGKYFSDEMKNITIKGIGLTTIILGIYMCISPEQGLNAKEFLITIFSLVLGGISGVMINIEGNLSNLGEWLKAKAKSRETKFVEGFVIASIIFETGPMAILGSINDGLTQDLTLLIIKSTLDGIMALVLATSYGIGVIFSIIIVLIYQGTITILAMFLGANLSTAIIDMIYIVGGILILGLGFRILEIQDIPIVNMIPAILWVIPVTLLFEILNIL